MYRPTLLHTALLGALLSPLAAMATPTMAPTEIQWAPCDGKAAGRPGKLLGVRLQCGTMQAPIDHLEPGHGYTDVALVRVLAEDQQRVSGSIFFNFGGPGANPREIMPVLAAMWSREDPEDAVGGYRKQVSRHFDMVAVVPRGLRGGDELDCFSQYAGVPFDDITSDPSDYNWQALTQDASELAASCTSDTLAPYVSTEQHAYDMELARLSLGEGRLNFVGFSYGTWVGAWYAAMFPDHVDRMVLDSAMDVTRTFAEADELTAAERHRDFLRLALRPALLSPWHYGLGTEEQALLARVRDMPPRARLAWSKRIDSPEALLAVLTMAGWVRNEPFLTHNELQRRITSTTFSGDAGINEATRMVASSLAGHYTGDAQDDDELSPDRTRYAVSLAVRCNDTPWQRDNAYWRGMARDNAERYPTGNAGEVYLALVCANWEGGHTRRPSLEPLHRASPFLMIQAQYDWRTPLEGATQVLNRFNNASLVVASNMSGHAILGESETPCVEEAVGRYLLEGTLPAHRFTSCEFVPATTGRADEDDPDSLQGLRASLGRLLKDS